MHNPPLILVIDDATDFLEIISVRLTSAGFGVKTANSAVAGFDMSKNLKPDLILLDINMPGMNGTEALLDFRKDPVFAGFKVAFLTDLEMPWPGISDKQEFSKELGAVAFFDKAKDLDSIEEKVKALLTAG